MGLFDMQQNIKGKILLYERLRERQRQSETETEREREERERDRERERERGKPMTFSQYVSVIVAAHSKWV